MTKIPRLTLVMLMLWMTQTTAFFLAERSLRPEGGMALAQSDVACYLQAANRIVEGHPFSYARDLPPTTGTTSVLYPFVLAVPVALGAKGVAGFAASFWINAVFYLVFLLAWGQTVRRLFSSELERWTAALLIGLSGHAAGVAFGQCDIGFFMAVSAVLAEEVTSGSARRRHTVPFLLALGPWVRPEGMMLVLAFGILAVVNRRWRDLVPVCIAGVSSLGVFALNYGISGSFMFSSVAEKGYFRERGFVDAAVATVQQLGKTALAYLCSVPTTSTRFFSTPCVFASLAFWIGLGTQNPRRVLRHPLAPLALAVLIAVTAVAQSGFSGIQYDRYLGWMMPFPALLSAAGVGWVTVRGRSRFAKRLPFAFVVTFSLFSTVATPLLFSRVTAKMDLIFDSYQRSAEALEGDPLIGESNFFGAFAFAGRRYVNLCGIYSPAYRDCPTAELQTDFLKRHPELRFDVWALWNGIYTAKYQGEGYLRAKFGELLPGGRWDTQLRKADWSAYDRANELPTIARGKELVDRMDVGYREDERTHARTAETRGGGYLFFDVLALRESDAQPMVEGGRCVDISESFDLDVPVGEDALLVLRTTQKVYFTGYDFLFYEDQFRDYPDEMRIEVDVNGRRECEVRVRVRPGFFTDVGIPVSGRNFTSGRARFTLRGRFASCGYWLLNPRPHL